MAKKKKRKVPKTGPVWKKTAEEATLDMMPKYNAHACKTGAHGDSKYNRAKEKRKWKREFGNGGVRESGRFDVTDTKGTCDHHKCLSRKLFGGDTGIRTLTPKKWNWILSPARLPVPPYPHMRAL